MEKLAILLTAAAIVAVAASAPVTKHEFRQITVDRAQGNRTLCPFKVEITDDPDRIPRRIKIVKCVHADSTSQVKTHHHKHKCDDIRSNDSRGQCVELRDQVYVKYKSTGQTMIFDAPVGCSCMFLDHSKAENPESVIG